MFVFTEELVDAGLVDELVAADVVDFVEFNKVELAVKLLTTFGVGTAAF